ncbi:hypothetical protein NMY22_g15452 [Coprinellus aureogranulatus]|nr:hypothetical protein NMY22_g15452 [Coprinellus aureogranulatus]
MPFFESAPLFTVDDVPLCPNCGQLFRTMQGVNAHLTMSKKCASYKKGKLREIVINPDSHSRILSSSPTQSPESTQRSNPPRPPSPQADNPIAWHEPVWPDPQEMSDDEASDIEERDYHEDLAQFIASLEHDEFELFPGLGDPGPQTQEHREGRRLGRVLSRALLDDEDTRVVEEPYSNAGKVIRRESTGEPSKDSDGDTVMDGDMDEDNPYAPFESELDWRVAQWAVKETVSQSAFDRLLEIPGVVEKLGLSFDNVRRLHQIVDAQPDKAGEWTTDQLNFPDDPTMTFTIRHRPILKAIESIFKNPDLASHLVYKPSKVYSDDSKENRIYSEMWTAKWWHVVQSQLPAHATVVPVIIATDKTQLTQFSGGKAAYPVYLTIGNVPKSLRRKPSSNASILIAYLSVDKMDRSKMTEADHRSKVQRVFHESMKHILAPLVDAGKKGIEMANYRGEVRQVHPILSCYVADYPEQCLVGCCKYGTCPKCQSAASNLANSTPSPRRTPRWTLSVMAEAKKGCNGSAREFAKQCMEQDVTGGVYEPFWKNLPYTDIHRILTPDVLHQLYQGVLKHVISCFKAYATSRTWNLISPFPSISGSERKDMAKILLPCLVGSVPSQAIKAVKALLDFIFLSQYPMHDDQTLQYMKDALDQFHKNKEYFITVNCHPTLNIPKLHSLIHYVESIQFFGTTDNYNTEMFERLHIDFAKEGWRATNQRDEFPQMIRWLSRQEKMDMLARQISTATSPLPTPQPTTNPLKKAPPIIIAKQSPSPNRPVSLITKSHRAPQFEAHLKQYLNSFLEHQLGRQRLERAELPISKIDVFPQFRFRPASLHDEDSESNTVKAVPLLAGSKGGRFDTVVVMDREDAEATGLEGTRIARVKVIFNLPGFIELPGGRVPLPPNVPKGPFAYVEWFTRQAPQADHTHGMYRIMKAYDGQHKPQGAVIPLSNIRQSCMLTPVFKDADEEQNWRADNVLDLADTFWVNNWAMLPRECQRPSEHHRISATSLGALACPGTLTVSQVISVTT